jgi:uncharacterized membrane protein
MKKIAVFVLLISIVLIISAISSAETNSCRIDFNQVGNKLIVKEIANGIEKEAYVTQEGLEESEEGYYFVKKIVFNESYEKAEVRLNLDYGIIIHNSEAYPLGYDIESDGQTISLIWKIQDIKAGDSFPIFVILENVNKSSFWIWIIIILLMAGIISWLLLKKKKKVVIKTKAKPVKNKTKIAEVEKYLLENEKKIISELENESRKELWQKQIQLRTGLSKVKLSRVLKNLESRGLIKKINFGKTNKIILKK